jgi:hypothetical protein
LEKKMKFKLLAIVASTLLASSAMAANQGTLGTGAGATSSGDLNITLSIDTFIQVTGLDDISLGTYAGTALAPSEETFCVRTNSSGYKISFSDVIGTAPAFALEEDGAGTAQVPFELTYVPIDTSSLNTTTVATAVNGGQSGVISETRKFDQCDNDGQAPITSQDNMKISVSVNEADLVNAPAGSYTGVLAIVVTAE